jgi:hypothetical protein
MEPIDGDTARTLVVGRVVGRQHVGVRVDEHEDAP